jgi:hypothetical protein
MKKMLFAWTALIVAIVAVIVLKNREMLDTVGGIITVLMYVAIALAIYFLPAMIANTRKHKHTMAIVLTNLFLGWTFLGWVAALVWACTNQVQVQPLPRARDPRWADLKSS